MLEGLQKIATRDGGAGAFVELLDEIPSLRVLDTTSNQVSEARARILDVLLKHRQHDQQRMVESTKSRPTIIMSPTPPRPLRQTSAFESISFDLTEAEAEDDEAGNDVIMNDEKALLKNVLEQPMDASGGPAIDLSHAYFNLLTSNFSPKRIITYSSVGNIYDAHDDELDGATLMVRSLYMHTAGAMNEVRASVVGELKHIQHDNIMRITAQLLGPSVYCFLYDLRNRKSLRDILENEYARTAFSWNLRVKTMLCIAQALHYVHEGDQSRRKPSFHGDINPSNIFVASDYSVAKLSGCGLSRLIATDRGRFHSGEAVFGSRGYRCPRYERGSCQYDAASDMFSFGVIAAELLTGCLQGTRKNPNGMSNDVLFDNLFGENPFEADLKLRPVAHRQVLESIGQIAAACMNLVPSSRPSAAAVIQFIAGIPLLPEPLTNDNA
ncbi:hypothetical protein MPSEU_000078300 [Mayamaea pseudoterrestris]|nr:hypothetical protein MPSEU_000078300 [Mayamaea pseudoterrestris]